KTSIICSPMTSLKTSIKTITYLSDTGCLEIQGASLVYTCLLIGVRRLERTNDDCHSVRMQMRERPLK
ncbi:hypothetical protein E7V09_25300, partial [Escherichia coli]|nr:hypothetical protein [Escherichia coli]